MLYAACVCGIEIRDTYMLKPDETVIHTVSHNYGSTLFVSFLIKCLCSIQKGYTSVVLLGLCCLLNSQKVYCFENVKKIAMFTNYIKRVLILK